jgi:hypothetical protein
MNGDIQEVREILDTVELPTGEETVYFPKRNGMRDRWHSDDRSPGLVVNLGYLQSAFLGQLISEKVGERYTLLPLQVSYNLVYDVVNNDRKFAGRMSNKWTYNRERVEYGYVIPDSVVIESDGELAFEENCRKIKVDVDNSSVFNTLAEAGLVNKPRKNVWDGGISFQDYEACVTSGLRNGFRVSAHGPSGRALDGVVVFIKEDKIAGLEKGTETVEIAKSEYQELLEIKKEREALLKNCVPANRGE